MIIQRYVPAATVTPVECVQRPSLDRTSCGKCGKTFAGGAIVSEAVEHEAELGGYCRERWIYCDHCDHIMCWREACSADGRVTGVPVSGPGYIYDRRVIERRLRRHPEAAGVSHA